MDHLEQSVVYAAKGPLPAETMSRLPDGTVAGSWRSLTIRPLLRSAGGKMTTPNMTMPLITLQARSGMATVAARSQHMQVINTHGPQVVDTWAFNRDQRDRVYVDGAYPHDTWPHHSFGVTVDARPTTAGQHRHWLTTRRAGYTIRFWPRATATDTNFWAVRNTMIIARTTWRQRCWKLVSRDRSRLTRTLESVYEHTGGGGWHGRVRAACTRNRVITWWCARRWTAWLRSPYVRRTWFPSTGPIACPRRRISG